MEFSTVLDDTLLCKLGTGIVIPLAAQLSHYLGMGLDSTLGCGSGTASYLREKMAS